MPKPKTEMRRTATKMQHMPEIQPRMQLSRTSTDQVSSRSLKTYLWFRNRVNGHPLANDERRKDKTLAEILDRIKSLEGKIDDLNIRNSFSATSQETDPLSERPSTAPLSVSHGFGSSLGTSIFLPSAPTTAPGSEDHYKYVSSVHEMLTWPAVQQVLELARPKTGLDLSAIARDGPAMILGLHDHSRRLPVGNTASLSHDQSLSFPPQGPDVSSLTIQSLTWETMQRLSKAYFDTFNLMYPILDQQSFVSSTMSLVFNEGFNEGMASTIALLICALGEVAIAGTQGIPIYVSNGRPSGMKGGTRTQPPGLGLFNEARRRMGFNLTACSLENVQIFALAGYDSNLPVPHCLLTVRQSILWNLLPPHGMLPFNRRLRESDLVFIMK